MSWWAPPSYLHHCNCDWLNHTMWSKGSCRPSPLYTTWYGCCHLVSRGPGYVWLVEPYHMVWLKSSAALKHGIWVHFASFFLHNTVSNMLCRLFDDCKYMDIYLPIPQEYCYFGKQKNSLYFFALACKDLWPSHSCLVNCAKCEQIPSKYVANWSVWKVFLKFIKFQSFKKKSIDGHWFRARMVRYSVGKSNNILGRRLLKGYITDCQIRSLWILWLMSENSKMHIGTYSYFL